MTPRIEPSSGIKPKQSQACGMENQRREALQFIILMGIVSLFGDVTYEGARSITGPYLALLGAGAGIVGLVADQDLKIKVTPRKISTIITNHLATVLLIWPSVFRPSNEPSIVPISDGTISIGRIAP